MNTVRSVGYGWAVLCLAGGGAYYFAKRSVNADRAERAMAEEKRRQQREKLRVSETAMRERALRSPNKPAPNAEHPETSDPAPIDHVQDSSSRRGGKFEATEPFRSRKGDRFS